MDFIEFTAGLDDNERRLDKVLRNFIKKDALNLQKIIYSKLSIEEIVSEKFLREELERVLNTLTDREQTILRLRYGMDDGRERTLEEVGKYFNVTRERIRQIEAKALRKLRHPSRSRKLKDFI